MTRIQHSAWSQYQVLSSAHPLFAQKMILLLGIVCYTPLSLPRHFQNIADFLKGQNQTYDRCPSHQYHKIALESQAHTLILSQSKSGDLDFYKDLS